MKTVSKIIARHLNFGMVQAISGQRSAQESFAFMEIALGEKSWTTFQVNACTNRKMRWVMTGKLDRLLTAGYTNANSVMLKDNGTRTLCR